MARAPAPPSSAGWKHRYTVPSKPPCCCRWRAAANSMAVWPSWPQPCILPSWRERCSNWFSSCIGRASMSARSMMARSDVPWRSTPTTPVLAMPVWTSMPQPRSRPPPGRCGALRSTAPDGRADRAAAPRCLPGSIVRAPPTPLQCFEIKQEPDNTRHRDRHTIICLGKPQSNLRLRKRNIAVHHCAATTVRRMMRARDGSGAVVGAYKNM